MPTLNSKPLSQFVSGVALCCLLLGMDGLVSFPLTLLKASSWKWLQHHDFLVLRSSLSGFVKDVMLGVNLLSWVTIPKNRLSSVGVLSFSILRTALVFWRSGEIPFSSIMWPRNVRCLLLNPYFCLFKVTPWDRSFWKTLWSPDVVFLLCFPKH